MKIPYIPKPIDYSTWNEKFPWVLSVHDRRGVCLYMKPGQVKRGGARKGAGRPSIPGAHASRQRRYRERHRVTEIKQNSTYEIS
jgi:hypothetical protein